MVDWGSWAQRGPLCPLLDLKGDKSWAAFRIRPQKSRPSVTTGMTRRPFAKKITSAEHKS